VTEAGETDRSFGYREPRGDNQSIPPTDRKPPRVVETLTVTGAFRMAAQIVTKPLRAIRRQFRELAAWLTNRHPAPQPENRREESAGDGFRFPPVPDAAPLLWDTVRWQQHRANYNRMRRLARNVRQRAQPRRSRPLFPRPRA